jgi:hypothetical protein
MCQVGFLFQQCFELLSWESRSHLCQPPELPFKSSAAIFVYGVRVYWMEVDRGMWQVLEQGEAVF